MSEDKKSKKAPKINFNFYWVYVVIALAFIGMTIFSNSSTVKEISPSEFRSMLTDGDVEHVTVVNKETAEVFIKEESLRKDRYKDVREQAGPNPFGRVPQYVFNTGDIATFNKLLDEAQAGVPVEKQVPVKYETRHNWTGEVLGWIVPIILLIGFWVFMMRRMSGGPGGAGNIFSFGKSRAQLLEGETSVNVTFNDVAGLEEAKVEIKEIVDFLKNSQKYTELGAKIPKGALLVGPPGTGKTLLAKAVAGEAKVPFFSLSGSDFVEMFVGVGASRVRDLFRQAKEKAPAIIFIDEIDAIGRARGRSVSQGANDERENTLNQLLTEMDGFGTNSGVIILAATNRADILDRALLRAGRFDRQIYVDMPDVSERRDIFMVHLKKLKLEEGLDIEFLARQTPGFSGADIANICNEAALIAARKEKKQVTKQDFLDAVDRIVGGLEKKNKIVTDEEKKVIAYHEAGHATVSWLVEHAAPLIKVTIVPRGKSLGAAWYLPEERQITNTEQIIDEMCAALGGRAAEQVVFGKVSTGALSDLEKVTKQAYAMVTLYGLSEKVGNISFYDSTGQSEYSFNKPYSEKTAELIDAEVKRFVDEAYARTLKIVAEHRSKLDQLADALLTNEVIFKEDLVRIFGARPFAEKEQVQIAPRPVEPESTQQKADEKPAEQPVG